MDIFREKGTSPDAGSLPLRVSTNTIFGRYFSRSVGYKPFTVEVRRSEAALSILVVKLALVIWCTEQLVVTSTGVKCK